MKPVNIGGHTAYQNRILTQLRKYNPDATNSLSSSTLQILDKFWNHDLSGIDSLMKDRYSAFGPEPRLPSDMLRSILVSVEFKITSYTSKRLWLSESKNLSNTNHPPKEKPQKPKGKEEWFLVLNCETFSIPSFYRILLLKI